VHLDCLHLRLKSVAMEILIFACSVSGASGQTANFGNPPLRSLNLVGGVRAALLVWCRRNLVAEVRAAYFLVIPQAGVISSSHHAFHDYLRTRTTHASMGHRVCVVCCFAASRTLCDTAAEEDAGQRSVIKVGVGMSNMRQFWKVNPL
jgi:hypothetical protein